MSRNAFRESLGANPIELSSAERTDTGIPQALIRYPVGVRNHDPIANLEQALRS